MGEVTFSAGALAIITALLTALVGTIGMLFRALIASKDGSLKDMTSQRDSYQKIAAQSIAALELAANRARRARGEQPFQTIPDVVPEHNSPTTQEQIDTAEYQTILARAAAAARELDLPPISALPATIDGLPKPGSSEEWVQQKDGEISPIDPDVVPPNVLIIADELDVRLKVGETITIEGVKPPPPVPGVSPGTKGNDV